MAEVQPEVTERSALKELSFGCSDPRLSELFLQTVGDDKKEDSDFYFLV